MLKALGSIESITRPGKGRVEVGDDSGNDGSYDNKYSPQGLGKVH